MDDSDILDENYISSSKASESENEDFFKELLDEVRPKNQRQFEGTIPQYNDTEFLEHFRVSRNVANLIAQQFQNSPYFNIQSGPFGKLNSLQQTYIFLWFARHQTSSFRDVADRFKYLTISSLFRIIKRMTYYLSKLFYLQISHKVDFFSSFKIQVKLNQLIRF